jgi:hypothetical protein
MQYSGTIVIIFSGYLGYFSYQSQGRQLCNYQSGELPSWYLSLFTSGVSFNWF